MNKIEIKGAIIPNNSIEAYKKEGKEYTALQDIELPPSSEPIPKRRIPSWRCNTGEWKNCISGSRSQ